MESPNDFVAASSVRTDIVRRLSEGTAATGDLLEDVSASNSAIYDALSTLEQRGICREGDSAWALTAQGQIVADSIDAWQSAEDFLAVDPEYWERHRLDVIPPEFRRRLPEIGDYEIVRDSPGEHSRHVQVALDRMAAADRCDITTPFYSKQHQSVVPNHPETRMLVTRAATDVSIQRYKDGHRENLKEPPDHQVRLTESRFASVVGDDFVLFTLPTAEGPVAASESADDEQVTGSVNDATATLVSETESAVQWGTDLFERLWGESDPIGPYMEREHPEVL